MKILLDTCVTGHAKAQLQAAGHDVVWSGDWDRDPGDDVILAAVNREGRVLVTLDKDFGELAILLGASHCGILRLVNFRSAEQAPVCWKFLQPMVLICSRAQSSRQSQAESEFASGWCESALGRPSLKIGG